MALHYSSGKLLLRNQDDGEWYFIEVRIDITDGLPHIYVHQTVGDEVSLDSTFDEYAIIRVDTGVLYKLGIETNGSGAITYSFEIATLPVAKLPSRIWIKDTTSGILYELLGTMSQWDALVYPQLTQASISTTTTLNSPFRTRSVTPVYDVDRCRILAPAITQRTIIISPYPNVSVAVLGGEGDDTYVEGEGETPIGG